jgi:cullin-associated NEDD8-dissociated protein 1
MIWLGPFCPQIASKDKDFRYMATSDLLNELQKDSFKVDADMERKLCTVILTQLDDASGDISGLAVKWWGGIVAMLHVACHVVQHQLNKG